MWDLAHQSVIGLANRNNMKIAAMTAWSKFFFGLFFAIAID